MLRGIFWKRAKNAEIGRIAAVGETRAVTEVTIIPNGPGHRTYQD